MSLLCLKNGAEKVDATNFQSVTGKGAYAEIDGVTTYIGSVRWAQELSSLPEKALQHATELQRAGKSVMAVVTGYELQRFDCGSGSSAGRKQKCLRKLKEIGIHHTVMLTGDHPETAKAIAAELGMTDVRAGLMPEDKLTAIKAIR